MGRDNRPNYEGAIYHAMNRGNRKQAIFEDDRDRRKFMRILVETQETYGVKTLAGSLMGNHFHLGLLTPRGNLSEFMQQLEGQYARYHNWRHRRVGHLFQGRFRHVLIEDDLHLLTALCYIFMNPVTARLASTVEDYKWSTYASTVGLRPLPSYITIDWLEALFPALSLREAQCRFRQMMSAPRPVVAYLDGCELNVGVETIRQVIRSYTGEQFQLASLPTPYRTVLRPDLESLLAQLGNDRSRFIREARVSFGYRNAEIAKVLRLRPATVSAIFRKRLLQ
ncbi:MAG TPA: transposase [Vicinamibacterales bacterium]|nr:transposase [Vicinamibacterales bacterium]